MQDTLFQRSITNMIFSHYLMNALFKIEGDVNFEILTFEFQFGVGENHVSLVLEHFTTIYTHISLKQLTFADSAWSVGTAVGTFYTLRRENC
jgi:hypothetical protein